MVSPHGHTEPDWFSDNHPFPDPTELILIPDHYIFRMLYSQGISLETLGIPTRDGSATTDNRRESWQIFADHYYLFTGTPTGVWLDHEFTEVFGIREKLNSDSAQRIYDQIAEKLAQPAFLPRTMFDRFNIEVLTTTDPAESTLAAHRKIRESGWSGQVIPCFHPDGVIDIQRADWQENINKLSDVTGIAIHSCSGFIRALERQRSFFGVNGCCVQRSWRRKPFYATIERQ